MWKKIQKKAQITHCAIWDNFRVIQPIVAEVKMLGKLHYPKEIPTKALSQKVKKNQHLKSLYGYSGFVQYFTSYLSFLFVNGVVSNPEQRSGLKFISLASRAYRLSLRACSKTHYYFDNDQLCRIKEEFKS